MAETEVTYKDFNADEITAGIIAFGEELAEIKLFPYQRKFAESIVKTVLRNNGKDVIGIFARQCIAEGSIIHTREGKLVRIEEHPDAWRTSKSKEIFELRVRGGRIVRATANHPIYTDNGWVKLGLLQMGDKVQCLQSWNKFGDGQIPYAEGVFTMTTQLAQEVGQYAMCSENTSTALRDLTHLLPVDEGFPTIVNYFTKNQTLSFLKTLWANKGTVFSNRQKTPISATLRCGQSALYTNYIQALMLKCGITSYVTEHVATFFNLHVRGISNLTILMKDIKGKPLEGVRLSSLLKREEVEQDGEVMTYARVVSIKSLGMSPVWDVTYPNKGWFICGGMRCSNSGKTSTSALTIASLMCLLPILSRIYPELVRFKRGIAIGAFAPVGEQVSTLFYAMRDVLESEQASILLSDKNLSLEKVPGKGDYNLSNGSFIKVSGTSRNTKLESKTYHLIFLDEAQSILDDKILLSIRPMGAFSRASFIWTGTPYPNKSEFYNVCKHISSTDASNYHKNDWKYCARFNPNYKAFVKGEAVLYGTDSDYFRMMYKLEWLFERGYFISSSLLGKALSSNIKRIKFLNKRLGRHKKLVGGLDLGKKHDSTVLTIGELDTYDLDDDGYYGKTVYNWLELLGDDYEAQYDQIIDCIENYGELDVLVIDATGLGEVVSDSLDRRFAKLNWNTQIVRVNFRHDKANIYQNLLSNLHRGRLRIPGGSDIANKKVFKRFIKQTTTLVKDYTRTGILSVHAEESVKDAHDDYPDSLALFTWAEATYMPDIDVDDSGIYR